ncbi:MAG: hypothetical protein ACREI3_05875, partial [Nitrospirales bacterium]
TLHGAAYTEAAQHNTLGRFLEAMEGHGFTLLFYVPVLFLGFFPWSGFLPIALIQTFRTWRDGIAKQWHTQGDPDRPPSWFARRFTAPATRYTTPEELDLFAMCWIVGVFLFFTLSATRLPHYIAPLFPACAILAASYWHRCLTDSATKGIRLSIGLVMGLGYLLGFAFVIAPYFYSQFVDQIAKEFPMAAKVGLGVGPYLAGFVLLMGMGVVGYYGLSPERRPAAFWAMGATIALVILVAIQVILPRASRYFVSPPQELAYAAGLNLRPDDRLILYGPSRPSLVFYARHKAIVIGQGQEEAMRPWLNHPGRTMILLPERLKSHLPPEAAEYPIILQRFGYLLLANEPMIKGLPAPQAGTPPTTPPPAFHSFSSP